MEGYKCPNRKCTTELQFEQIHGMRLYTEVGRKKIFNAYCPTCDEHMQVDAYNRKVSNELS
jgi:hypothetical protein